MQVAWPNVLAWRVHQHYLDELQPPSAMLDIAQRLCGLHAQVLSSAELTLWARTDGLARGAVQGALWTTRELVKVWAMRGTLHLFPAAHYPTWQAAMSTFRMDFTQSWLNWYGVTQAQLNQIVEAVGDVLDGHLLTRTELADAVAKHTGSQELGDKILKSSWGSMLKPPTRRGYVCFAPSVGQNVRFTRPSSWLPDWRLRDPDASLREVGRHFLHAYGPATPRQLALWWGGGSGSSGSRRMLELLEDDLTAVELDGTKMWLLTDDLDDIRNAQPQRSVRLLPAFDQYVVGAPREPSPVLRPELKSRVYRNQGWFTPVLLVDGRMVGIWRHTTAGSRLSVEIEAFEELPKKVQRAAEAEAERLAAFLGGKLALSWQPLDQRGKMQDQSSREAAS